MRILILEDEPLIADDLEEIVHSQVEADIVCAMTLSDAMRCIDEGVDFALLDVSLGSRGENSLPIAEALSRRQVPFGFVSGSLERLPNEFHGVPRLGKPFMAHDVKQMIPCAEAA